jgi:HSP20 family protein
MASSDDIRRRVRQAQGEMDLLVRELWAAPRAHRSMASRAPADVYVTEDPPTLTVQLDVAGADPTEIHVEIEADLLTIRGTRTRSGAERRIYHHAEIDWGPFERRLRLNVPVDAEGVTAVYERGILSIDLPLAERVRERRIRIAVVRRPARG